MPIAVWVTLAAQIAAGPVPPPPRLQIFRERLKPNADAEYDRIESDTARKCAELRCPHPYLGVESLTGPKEAWWFNAYDSVADQKRVEEAWARDTKALAVLGSNRSRKATLVDKGTNVFGSYREDLSAGPAWLMGRGRFLVITVTRSAPGPSGTVYEAEDGTRLVIVPARTRAEADAATGPGSRVFAVRPSWSHPAEDWISSDPEFWRHGR